MVMTSFKNAVIVFGLRCGAGCEKIHCCTVFKAGNFP